MKKLYLFLMLLLGSLSSFAQISIRVTSPSQPYVLCDTAVSVYVYVTSANPVAKVTAAVNNRQVDLPFYPPGNSYYGSVPIAGLPSDTLLLTITATDSLQNTGDTSIAIIHDPLPTLVIDSPSVAVVAQPFLHLKARGFDNDPVKYMRVVLSHPVNLTTTAWDTITFHKDNIDTVLDVVARSISSIEVWDQRNQRSSISRQEIPYTTNENPVVAAHYVAPYGYRILDFKYNKALIVKDSTYGIADIASDSITFFTFGHRLYGNAAWLTPGGAILATDSGNFVALFEWDQELDTITVLEQILGGSPLVAGDYLLFRRGHTPNVGVDSLFLRNMRTRQDTLIDDTIGEADVAANGTVVYRKGNTLYQYRNGVKTAIANGQDPNSIASPRTDGNGVLYIDNHYSVAPLYLYDGTTTSHVVDIGLSSDDVISEHYRLNSGYIAYISGGGQGPLGGPTEGVWIRDLQGNHRMLASFEGNRWTGEVYVSLRYLSPDGGVMFHHSQQTVGGTYYGNKNGLVRKLTSGKPNFYFENGWYMASDNVLFKLNADTTLNHHITPFDKYTLTNPSTQPYTATPIQFTANDFFQHYTGPAEGLGRLSRIAITALPKYGKLQLRGQNINGLGDGVYILRDDLDSLRYIPGVSVVGVDTFQWKAYNGIEYTSYDTSVALHVLPVLRNTAPKLKTLDSQYCATTGPRTIKITNYPRKQWHTTVTVTLDSTTILPVAADSTFTITPAAYDTGTHRIKVTFSHPLDSISTIAAFKVVTGIQPKVNLTANINPVTGSATSVVVTANNQTTGTTSARYTFAKDSGFTSILQKESTLKTLTLPASALVIGINPIYVRMKVSGACLGDSIATDSIHIIKAAGAPLQQPVITSIAKQYCQTASPVKVKILNLPSPQTANVKVTLDNKINLPVGGDSSFVINPAAYAAGNHSVRVTFANVVDSLSTVVNFTITARAAPDVNLSANINMVINLKDTVVITAANVSGGGKAPLYTFAWNSSFTNVIQWEGVPASITVDPASLAIGNNWIYVRMKTSEACYAYTTATDSINIIRSIITAAGDIDPRNEAITVYPNPFNEQFTVNRLKPEKTYILTLYDPQGRPVLSRRTVGQSRVVVPAGTIAGKGVYLLKIYEENKKGLPKILKLLHL